MSTHPTRTPHPPPMTAGLAASTLALAACVLVAGLALVSGTAVSVRATRVTPRVTAEAIETRGVVTVPVQRVIAEGRVDVTLRRRILGVVPWTTHRLADVVDAGVTSGRHTVRGARGRGTSSYGSAALVLRTRAGTEWRSDAASGVVGGSPGEAAERLRALIAGDSDRDVALWWAPWLENLVGIPFALVASLVLWSAVRVALRNAAAPAP